jgi:uncharacterized protein (TIGR00251 family)
MTASPTGSIGDAIREHADGCTLAIRVQPGAKKTAITGVYGEGTETRLKIALQAPPIDGRANETLVGFLAEVFSQPRSAVTIAHGQTGRSKLVVLRGMKPAQGQAKIQARARAETHT